MIARPEDLRAPAPSARRLLHVLAPAPFGGLEQVVRSLALQQQRDPGTSDVRVATLGPPPDAFVRALSTAAVEVVPILTPARGYAAQCRALVRLCRAYGPDIVHYHGAHADVIGAAAARDLDAAMVSTIHGQVGGDLRNRLYEWMQRRACVGRDAVVAVSRPLAVALIAAGLPPARMHVVRNAWRADAALAPRRDARLALGLPTQGFLLGWVGRLSREKALDTLLDALAIAPMPEIGLAIIGDGRERGALQARGARTAIGAANRLHWLGPVPDASRYLGAFDALVVSSRTEGTPLVLLEAMAAGLPVIATAVGGIPDVLGASEGHLVPPDDATALRDAIEQVHRDPTDTRRRAAAATTRAQGSSDLTQWGDRYALVYDAALTARHAGTASRAGSAP